jgi:hypothetical protein
MATLILPDVPDDLYRQLEAKAAVEKKTVAEVAWRLLRFALTGQYESGGARPVAELLAEADRVRADMKPSSVSVVDLLREDRER